MNENRNKNPRVEHTPALFGWIAWGYYLLSFSVTYYYAHTLEEVYFGAGWGGSSRFSLCRASSQTRN